jgi:Arc-like DNA binding domain
MARKPSETVALTLRIREELRKKLEKAAKRENRTLNGEIEQRLEHAFATDALIADGSLYAAAPTERPLVELPKLITLALTLAPKGNHRTKALQVATSLICEAFFSDGLSDERSREQLRQAVLSDDPGSQSGSIIALSILRKAGLASHVSLDADDPEFYKQAVIKALMKGAKP